MQVCMLDSKSGSSKFYLQIQQQRHAMSVSHVKLCESQASWKVQSVEGTHLPVYQYFFLSAAVVITNLVLAKYVILTWCI